MLLCIICELRTYSETIFASSSVFKFQPCGTGDLDGGPERAQNFMDIIDEMKFAFSDVFNEQAATTTDNADVGTPVSYEESSASSPVSSPISESSSSSSSLSCDLGGKTGAAAVEETFLAMKTAIDERIFLYETPLMEWVPSSVYRFDGFFSGMQIMHSEGVAGNTLYMGGECDHCHMYGLVNVAAFLAQAMKETIRYVSVAAGFVCVRVRRVWVERVLS